MLSKKVLVQGITNLSEARYCAGMMVDMLSFDFDTSSENYIETAKFNEIRNWLSGVLLFGEGKNLKINEIRNLIVEEKLDGFIFNESQAIEANKLECAHKILKSDLFKYDLSVFSYQIANTISEDKNTKQKLLLNNKTEDFSDNVAGYVFKGSKEEKPGQGNNETLIAALETLDVEG